MGDNNFSKCLGVVAVGTLLFTAATQPSDNSAAAATPTDPPPEQTAPPVDFKSLSSQYNDWFVEEGREHGVDPILLAAVAKQESGFNPNAGSHVGAQGLMQFMPGTARQYGIDPWNPHQAIDGAARFLNRLLARYNGSVDLALAGYNAGTNAVDKYGGVPPYRETRNYVRSIKAMIARAS